MSVLGIHHAGLTVRNLEESIAFYCNILGLRLLELSEVSGPAIETITGIAKVRVRIADIAFPNGGVLELIEYLEPKGVHYEPRTYNPGDTHIALLVQDIDQMHRWLRDRAVIVRSSPVKLEDGGEVWNGAKVFYSLDPDGRTVELIELPHRGTS